MSASSSHPAVRIRHVLGHRAKRTRRVFAAVGVTLTLAACATTVTGAAELAPQVTVPTQTGTDLPDTSSVVPTLQTPTSSTDETSAETTAESTTEELTTEETTSAETSTSELTEETSTGETSTGETSTEETSQETTDTSDEGTAETSAENNYGVNLDYDFLDDETKANLVGFAKLLIEEDGAGIGDACLGFNGPALDRTWADPANREKALEYLRSPDALTEDDGFLTWADSGLDGSMIGNYQGLEPPCALLLSSAQSAQDPIGCYAADEAAVILKNDKIDEKWSYCFLSGYFAVGGKKAGSSDGSISVALLREAPDGVVTVVIPAAKKFDEKQLTDTYKLPSDAVGFLMESKRWQSLNDKIN